MNKYHVLWVIERLLQKPKGPSWQDILIPGALFLGLLLALLATNFHDFLGLKATIWEAMTCMLAALSFVATIILLILWCIDRKRNPTKTSEQIFKEITDQMAQERERLAQITQIPKIDKVNLPN